VNTLPELALKFLASHRVGSLSTLLKDGSPHAAALHYSHTSDPLTLFFSTDKSSRKCESLLEGNAVKSAFVVGFSEEEWITLQLDGEAILISSDELAKAHEVHYAKHPNSAKYKDDPATVFIKFTPTWWRYTDYNTVPETIVSSTD
jgi:general stress protein 26